MAQLYTNLPAGSLKKEVRQLLEEYTQQANQNGIDIPRTLKNFFTMRD
jgi:FKBP-type peptidyl-prolyl cis-trans isomerase (trigger factor)